MGGSQRSRSSASSICRNAPGDRYVERVERASAQHAVGLEPVPSLELPNRFDQVSGIAAVPVGERGIRRQITVCREPASQRGNAVVRISRPDPGDPRNCLEGRVAFERRIAGQLAPEVSVLRERRGDGKRKLGHRIPRHRR
jgi:hypothetical protein